MEADLKKLIKIIHKRFWVLMIIPLISILIAGYLSIYVIDPLYESKTSLIVINEKEDPLTQGSEISYDDLLIGQELVKDYTEIIKSRRVTSTVIEELNLKNITPEKLASRIEVEAKNGTSIIEITVKANNPREARMIAKNVGQVFDKTIYSLWGNRNVKILDEAELPQEPVSPRLILNIILALMAGLFMGVIVIFAVEYLDNTIKSAEEAEERLDIPVLGIIPELRLR